jgi:hypothetical protein
MHDSTVRKRKLRAQRKQAGMKAYELWLDSDAVGLLERLRQREESLSDLISRALLALEAQEAHPASQDQSAQPPRHSDH